MKFLTCTLNCKHCDQSIKDCFNTCRLPYDILKCVENYFNNSEYPEYLEMDLTNIVERGKYVD